MVCKLSIWVIGYIKPTLLNPGAMNNITYQDSKAMTGLLHGQNLKSKDNTEKNLLFEACLLATELERNNLNMLRRLCQYEIIWLVEGSAKCTVDMQEHYLSGDTMYILAPGQIHLFEPAGSITGYFISFSQEFLIMTGGNLNMPFGIEQQMGEGEFPVIHIDNEMKSEMEDLIKRMIKELSHQFQLKSEILMGLLKILIIYFSRKVVMRQQEKAQHHDMILMKRFKHLLEQHFFTKKTVADYASELAVSPNYLSGKVKTISGFSASHHIQQRIVLEAKRKVMFSGGSLKEVAYYLGFDDTSHFSKFFKNKSGINFTDFKKAIC